MVLLIIKNTDTPTSIAAYGNLPRPRTPLTNNNRNNNNSHHHSTKSTTQTNTNQQNRRFTLHHTSNGKRFISESPNSTRAQCSLCFNKHPNPWHDTMHCPFKHTTHIIDKAIRKRVMQHNALHGAENRHFTKDLDSPSTGNKPISSLHSPATANCAITDNSTTDIDSTLDHEPFPSPTLNDHELHEIVNTETFEVPLLPQANMGHTSPLPNITEDFALDDLIFKPTQYLSYSS